MSADMIIGWKRPTDSGGGKVITNIANAMFPIPGTPPLARPTKNAPVAAPPIIIISNGRDFKMMLILPPARMYPPKTITMVTTKPNIAFTNILLLTRTHPS